MLLFFPLFFFFNDTAPTEIYTLSLHDALPIRRRHQPVAAGLDRAGAGPPPGGGACPVAVTRSEEHTSELQSLTNLVCRLLLEKKKKNATRDAIKPQQSHVTNSCTYTRDQTET